MFSLRSASLFLRVLGLWVLLVVAVAPSVVAQVPRLLHYQATLVEDTFPAEGTVDVSVAFYDEPAEGTPLANWGEEYIDVELTAGRFDLLLGSQQPLPDALFDAAALYLEITVDGEVLPRLAVASTPFALRAGVAEAVAPGGVPADALADAAVTDRAIAAGAVTEPALATGSVTAAALGDEAVTTAKIAPRAVTTTELADDAVTSAKIGLRAVVGTSLADGAVTTDKLANGSVTASKVATGQLVASLNGLTDAVRLVGGENVTITPSASAGTITIDAETDQRSSRRWKTDIRPIDDPLALVQRLRGVRYQWIDSGAQDVGLIAEEVGAVVPEVVRFAPNGVDAEAVNYARLVALLIEAVKAQQAQIDADRAQMAELRARLDALERSIP